MDQSRLFEGLKVLDLSSVLAGPSVATFFAELGAEVIKIENPKTNGDVTRTWKLASEDPSSSVSAYFSSINYKKKYVWLDISKERAILEEYLAKADVAIANYKWDDYSRYDLEPKELLKKYPKLIFARLRGFDSNPHRVAYDLALQAETGFMYMNGTADSGPIKMPVALMDVLAAHQLKEGILCALIRRGLTQHGMIVECSLEASGIASLANQASNFLMAGHIPERLGSLHPNIAPYGEMFECQDGLWMVLAVGSDKQFGKLCEILELPQMITDQRFNTNQNRLKNRMIMAQMMRSAFAAQSSRKWNDEFIKNDVPAGIIKSLDEVFRNPIAQDLIRTEMIDGFETKRVSGVAFRIVD